MKIARLGNITIEDMDSMEPEDSRWFEGIWAQRLFGGNPAFYGSHLQSVTLQPDQKYFKLTNDAGVHAGGVLATQVNVSHRRACLHISVHPDHRGSNNAKNALIAVGAILGDSVGIEVFYTYALPGTPGHRVAISCGLEQWGRLKEYTLTPGGRSDTLVLGGLWKNLRIRHLEAIASIEWLGG